MPDIEIDFTDVEEMEEIKIERLDKYTIKFIFTETFETFVEGSITTILLSNSQFKKLLEKMKEIEK